MASKKKAMRRALSLVLSAAMTMSLLPATIFAAESGLIEDNSEIVQWTDKGWGVWADEVHFRETPYNATAEEAHDTVTVPFTGTGIQVYGKKASNGNIMTASIDGGEPVDVDFYGNQGDGNKQLIFEVKDLEPGEHTLVMTNTNRHNEAAKPLPNAEGNYQPEINYFMVLEDEKQEPDVPDTGDNFADGAIHDKWEQDKRTQQGMAIMEVEDGKLHLKAGAGNGNSHVAGPNGPAVFVDKTASEALAKIPDDQPKFFEFTVESLSAKNDFRLGLFLNYDAPNSAAFVGTDASGWFWETYPGDYYKGDRQPTLDQNGKATVRVEWTGKQITKATVNGTPMFATPVDISSVQNDKTGTVAFRVASYNGNPTEALISDVKYSGQEVKTGYVVKGTVADEAGKALAGASVEIGGKIVLTNDKGEFSFTEDNRLVAGDYTATITKDGYSVVKVPVKVTNGEVTVEQVQLKELAGVTGQVLGAENKPVAYASVTVTNDKGFNKTVYADDQGAFSMKGVPAGEYQIAAAGDFHYNSEKQALTVPADGGVEMNVTLAPMKTEVLHTAAMDVTVSTDFPTALKYDMKGELEGKTMFGQTRAVNQILVNGKVWVTAEGVKATRDGENAMKYDIPVKVNKSGVDLDVMIHAELRAEGNVLTFTITDVTYNRGEKDRLVNPLEQIYFFDQSLASVRSNQPGAKVATANLAGSTIQSGDRFADVNADFDVKSYNGAAVRYAFVSNDELSAGVFSNSDIGNGGAGSDNNRVVTTAVDRGAYKNVGANSNQWYYDRKISSVDPANAADVADVLTAEQKVVGIREGRDQQPYVRVVITGEQNNDGNVNWQDAAIVAREQEVVHIPVHSDKVADAVTTRIAMNFESEAPNPFLTSLDNVKRVALHSDGLGQSVLLKGYASEGHDSGHPDYYDIGERMGGVEDFKTMLHEGHKYGAQFGIHVNASEFYPEADAFSDNAVRWDGTRKNTQPKVHYGWNWLDQGIAMNGVYDLAIDGRYNRFQKLHDLVGDNSNGGDGLDYIYVDVWGNNTSGSENAWHTRKLSNDITSGGNDWRIVHEWSFANDWDSTFQHWTSDFAYGDYAYKGKLNSEIMRFMLNSYKDSFTPDFPSYGGAANAPLLGGPVMQGFEGWQSDYEYDQFIDTLYNQMLPTKFLQHYDIMQWIDNDEAVTLPYGAGAGDFNWGRTSEWTPEVQIALQSQDGSDKVVVTRGSDSEINETYAYSNEAERLEYRSRNITLNGRTVLVGASNPGEFKPERAVKGDLRYLLPWYWDNDGKVVDAKDEKLYHYNIKGGETKWQLPEGWENLENVVVYKLTDQGRTEETKVAVKDGWVTLNAEAEVPYIVVKGTEGAKAPEVQWTAPGQHLTDVSFNSDLKAWNPKGSAEIAKTTHETPMLKLTGESSVSQKLTFDEKDYGKKFAAYVGVDNKSDAKASITILDSKGNVVASQYTLRSFVPNAIGSYVHQDAWKDRSCFQNMYVFFTPEKGEEYTMVLSREAGEGETLFDDVRVAERGIFNVQEKGEKAPGVVDIKDNFTYDKKGNLVSYQQDFEHNAQGLYPFVAYNGGQVTDCRMHLSKLHAPYTQAGWDTKKADDVLDGNWSIKINGQVGRNALMYTTIPQNFHFEPGKFYTVEFDYQMGSDGTYEAVILDGGVQAENVTKRISLEKSLGETAHAEILVQGSESGQTGVGIWSTGKGAQVPAGAHADFGGYKDFMLDNLVIKPAGDVVQVELSNTNLKRGEMADIVVTTNMEDGRIEHWDNTNADVAVVDGDKVKAIGGGETTLTAHLSNGETKSFVITVTAEADLHTTGTATANTEEQGGEGPDSGYAKAASDGNSSTFWHSAWSSDSFTVSAENPAILNVDFGADLSIEGIMLQQRPSGPNGIVNQFSYRIMDAEKNTLKEGQITVPESKRANGAIIEIPCKLDNVHFVEIKVTNGHGGFAALAEVAALQHGIFTDRAELPETATVGTDEGIHLDPVTKPGEVLMGAVWTSSNPEIATVDADGNVSGVMEGETTITLSNACGDLATCKVTVTVSEGTKQAAAEVEALIDGIGTVTLEKKEAVEQARTAYDSLSDAAKALVKNLDVLKAAEAKLDELAQSTDYTDVTEGDWFYEGVKYVTENGMFVGIADKTFGPSEFMTRATVVQVLYSMAGKPAVEKTDKFDDVSADAWYANAVAWAVENGVTAGVGDNKFAPDVTITREELAQMLWACKDRTDLTDAKQLDDFVDAGEISDWAREAMGWAVENGIMSGVGNNKISPKTTATRAEGAVMFMQFDKLMHTDK